MSLYPLKVITSKSAEEIYKEDLQLSENIGLMSDNCKPYFVRKSKKGALLIHGFAAAPKEIINLAKSLEEQDYSVYCVRVAGHGTNIDDMIKSTYKDWYDSINYGYSALSSFCDSICIVGQSNGGLLASAVAAYNKCDSLALLAPAFKVRIHGFFLVKYLKNFFKGIPRFLKKEHKDFNYRLFPFKSLNEMRLLQEEAQFYIQKISVPVLTAISNNDVLVDRKYALESMGKMKSISKTTKIYDNIKYKVSHILTGDNSKEIIDEITQWIVENTK